MANYNKNMFIGIGGREAINLSHFIGAVYGMERMMGIADNPLRRILNYASDHFVTGRIPVVYILTVIGAPTTLAYRTGGYSIYLFPARNTQEGNFIGNCVIFLIRVCVVSVVVWLVRAGPASPGDKRLVTRGLFIGDDVECFEKVRHLARVWL